VTGAAPIDDDDSAPAAPISIDGGDARDAEAREAPLDDDEVVRISSRTRPSNLVLLISAILVVALANVVVGWLALSATTQLRDQSTAADGLQRCLITAELNTNASGDPNGTILKAAEQACLRR
jgi:hypothetical protein